MIFIFVSIPVKTWTHSKIYYSKIYIQCPPGPIHSVQVAPDADTCNGQYIGNNTMHYNAVHCNTFQYITLGSDVW